jgi:hypothetical protein
MPSKQMMVGSCWTLGEIRPAAIGMTARSAQDKKRVGMLWRPFIE